MPLARRTIAVMVMCATSMVALAACSTTVSLQPAPDANNPRCAEVTVRFPQTLDGFERRWTDAQATGAWGEQGGGSNIISSILSFFGGGRAMGGPVEAGKIYKVNENTPNSEFFAPGVDGTIIPRLKGMGMPTGAGRQVVEHRITVSPERDSFITLAADAAGPVVAQGGAVLYGAQKQEQAMAQRRARQRFV